jgi:hypothetical protein
MHDERQIPIWYFIGLLLTVYGVLILGSGLYGLVQPPAHKVALWEYHADIWWGVVLLIIGLIYAVRFRPGRENG